MMHLSIITIVVLIMCTIIFLVCPQVLVLFIKFKFICFVIYFNIFKKQINYWK